LNFILNVSHLQRAARHLLSRCGADGPQRALVRAQDLRARGQHRSAENWKDIAAAAARLQAEQALAIATA
jgi:hypothetical protein